MKLIYCPVCHDLIRLIWNGNSRSCLCGASGGYYDADGLNATIWGEAIPFGLDNSELLKAIDKRA